MHLSSNRVCYATDSIAYMRVNVSNPCLLDLDKLNKGTKYTVPSLEHTLSDAVYRIGTDLLSLVHGDSSYYQLYALMHFSNDDFIKVVRLWPDCDYIAIYAKYRLHRRKSVLRANKRKLGNS